MSTTESIQLVDKLVKAKIPKPTATELVDRIDKNIPDTLANDVHWLKWVVALGFSALIALMFGIVGIVTYLHNDMKAEIHSVRTGIQSVRTEMQSMQKETNAKIDQLNAKIDQILLRRR